MTRKKDTFNYNLKQGNKVVYKGTTNDLERREKEHLNDGKVFNKIEKVGRAKTAGSAKETEAKELETYRRNHGGKNPKYNKDSDG